MSSHERRAAARRRAWGRGPIILRFEALEGRQLLSASATAKPALPDLVGVSLSIPQALDWGNTFEADGQVLNQGNATTTAPFNVQFFASATPALGPNVVSLGGITLPAGLAPGKATPFQAALTLPNTPIPNAADNKPIYIEMWTDPEGAITESNTSNNHGVGPGYDIASAVITPPLASNLIGSTFAVSPQQSFWGQSIKITAQVQNNAQGDAPATRARITLTPAGVAPGGPSDVTIGYLNVPAISAWQTVNVQQTITLPQEPPSLIAGATGFTVSMIQDADFQANILSPHLATRGLGLDQAQISIGPNPDVNVGQAAPSPDLAADGVQVANQTIDWGQTVQVTTGVDNLGPGAAGPFDVRFLLAGANGSLDHAIYLGDVTVPGLGKNLHQDINATLKLPNRLPSGVSLSSVGVGRIAMVVDPDNTMDERLKSNNEAESNPVALRLLGSDGSTTVPTLPASTTPTPTPKLGAATPAGTLKKAAAVTRSGKIVRRPPHKSANLAKEVEHRLTIFPKQVHNFVNDLIHGKGAGSVNVNTLVAHKAQQLAKKK